MKKLISFLVFANFLFLSYTLGTAEVPPMINYQGKMTTATGALIVDTTVTMEFKIYDDSTLGNILWQETQNNVKVELGIFNVLLGSVTPIPGSAFDGNIIYLGVKVGDDPELTPRKRIASVGYALHSGTADTAYFSMPDADWVIVGDTICHLNGNVGIGTASPINRLDVNGYVKFGELGFIPNFPEILFNSYHNGTEAVYTTDNSAFGIYHNQLNHGLWFMYTRPGAAGNHINWDLGIALDTIGNVGIGTASPGAKLDVVAQGDGAEVLKLHTERPWVFKQRDTESSSRLCLEALSGNKAFDIRSYGGFRLATFFTYEDGGLIDFNANTAVNGQIEMTGFKMSTGATNGYVLTSDASGVGTWQAAPGGIGGSGTTNYIPKFTASTTLGNSVIYETGGNIGIGTTSPTKKLHVVGQGIVIDNSGSDITLYGASDDVEHNHYLKLINATGLSSAMGLKAGGVLVADNYSYANPAKTDLIVEGNVGIGTASPTSRLTVQAPDNLAKIKVLQGDGDQAVTAGTYGDGGGFLRVHGVGGEIDINLAGDRPCYFNAGNVGIGTTSPSYDLHVNGTFYANTVNTGLGNYELYAMDQNVRTTDNPTFNRVSISDYGTAGGGFHVGGTSDPGTDNLIVDGNVGIGTTSPGAKLDVNGSVIVDGPGGSINAITANTNGTYSGVAGLNTGTGPGVYGESHATQSGTGAVTGKAKEDGGSGIYGETWSPGVSGGSSVGVFGNAPATGEGVGGAALGVLGKVGSYQDPGNSSVPAGVFGWATATSGVNAGVYGQTDSPDGFGVYSKGKLEVNGNINTNGIITAGSSSSKLSVGTFTVGEIIKVVQNSSTDPIADAWTTYSSKRWKENIRPIEGALDKTMRLRGVYFDWKETKKQDIGMIAEEVGEIIPEVVAYEENGVDAKSIDYARLTALLVEAIKEQQKEIEAMKAKLEKLESKH